MGSPTRFKNGVTNVSVTNPLANFGHLDPTTWVTYFDDFSGNTTFPVAASGLAAASNNNWTLTVTEGGAGDASAAHSAAAGGFMVITNDAADNDLVNAQLKSGAFSLSSTKQAYFKTRFKVSDATQSDLFIGLATIDTTLLGATAGDGVTDGIFFQKDDGSTTLTIYCQKNTTTGQTSATAATLADNTFVEVIWYYNGNGTVFYYVDGVLIGSLDGSSTYLPDATDLTVSFSIMNGEAVAKSMTIDYILAAVER